MLRALLLGAIQGLTEFVPVSSSGHLVLVPFVLGWDGGGGFRPGVPFDVAVHLGTALAVVAYFRRDLAGMALGVWRSLRRRGDRRDRGHARLAALLALGSAPAAIAGVAFERSFEDLFGEPALVAGLLLGTAALLLAGDALHRRRPADERRSVQELGPADAVVIGLMQAIAIAPGVSRSASTIVGGLWRGMSREAAARFSFLLGLPAIAGAGLVQLPDFPARTDWAAVAGGTLAAAALGFLSIAYLLRYLRRGSLLPFAAYCVAASGAALAATALAG